MMTNTVKRTKKKRSELGMSVYNSEISSHDLIAGTHCWKKCWQAGTVKKSIFACITLRLEFKHAIIKYNTTVFSINQ